VNYKDFLYEPMNEGFKDKIGDNIKYWKTGKTKAERDELNKLEKEHKSLSSASEKAKNMKVTMTSKEAKELAQLKHRLKVLEKNGNGNTKTADDLRNEINKKRKKSKVRLGMIKTNINLSNNEKRQKEINSKAEKRAKRNMTGAAVAGGALVTGGILAGKYILDKKGKEAMDKKPFDEAYIQGYYDALNEMENNTNYDIYDDIENEADFDNEYEDAFLEGFNDAMNDIKTNPFPIIGGHDIKGDLLAMYQMGNGPERIAAIKAYLDTGKKITGGLIGGEYGTEGGVFYRKNKFLPGSAVNPEEAAGYISLYSRLRPQDRKRIMDAYKKSKR